MAAESVLDSIDECWNAQQGDLVETPPKKRRGAANSEPGSSEKGHVNAKAKAKSSAAKAKAKAQVRRSIVKKCKGCRKKLAPGEAAPNWPGCWGCKRSLDNICRLAKKQGPKAEAWVSEVRSDADDTRLYNMIQSYNEKCPESNEGGPTCGRKRGKWCLIKYIERVKAASEMMWEKLFMEFSQTVRGGKMTEEAAQNQWNTWVTAVKNNTAKADGVMFDWEGPQGKLRIWIKTADKLIYRSQYFKEKEIYCEGDTTKKATDEDVDKLRPELMQNHGTNMSFEEIAPVLAQSGKDAFQANDGFMLDILDLQPDTGDMNEDEEAPAQAPAEAEKKDDGPKLWVERDRIVSASLRAAKSQNAVFVQKGLDQLEKQEQTEQETLAEMGDKQKEHMAGELKMWRVRLEAMAICFRDKDSEALKRFIARFTTVEATDSSMPDQPVRMGACPPCELYAKLKTVDILDECAGKYQNATTPQHVKDVSTMLTDYKAPLQQLLQGATKAERSIKAAREQLKRASAKQAAQESKKGQANAKASESPALFDQGVAAAKQIQIFEPGDIGSGKIDFKIPFIVRAASIVKDVSAGVESEHDGFKTSFNIGRANSKGMRASKQISEAGGGDVFVKKLQDVFKDSEKLQMQAGKHDGLKKHMVTSSFGIDVGYDKVSCEPAFMSAFRLTLEGTRTVVMTDWLQLIGFMQRQGVALPIPPVRQAAFLRSMSPEMLKQYVEEASLWTSTLGAGDLIYVPFGFLTGELCTVLTFGLRLPLIVKATADPNLMGSIDKKLTEVEQTLASAKEDAAKARLTIEVSCLRELSKAMSVADTPAPAAPAPVAPTA
ncbi:unnamed protein product [Symbiodinium sp. CCMP2456]|nr:unnamed protein product [Symbiodinium sp. CCMP2456]